MTSQVHKPERTTGKFFKGMLLFGATALMVLLAACGSSTPAKSNSHSVLTISPGPSGDFTENFNPLLNNGNGGNLFGTDGLVYETLAFYNQMQANSVTPMLAQSQSLSTDGLTATFNLRQGVKWSDGQAFTSADVVFTINYVIQNAGNGLDRNGLASFVKGVTAPDANTVVVTFKAPSATNMWYLAGQTYILPKHIWQSVTDPKSYANNSPIGTGPYTVKSFSPQIYKFTKNTHYWQPGLPKVDEVDYLSFNSNTSATTVLTTGQLDWTGLFVANVQSAYVNRDPAHNQFYSPGNNTTIFMMNLTEPLFQDLKVRQAISAALNRSEYNTIAESGEESVANPTGLLLPNFQTLLDPSITQTYSGAQADQAKSILQSDGWTLGSDGYFTKAGKQLAFGLMAPKGWSDWNAMQTLIATDLKAAGMNVTVQEPAQADWFTKTQNGNFDTSLNYTSHGPSPYYFYDQLLGKAFTAPVGQAATTNDERWNDPKTEQLLSQFANTTDLNVQKQALYGLENIMVSQLPVIPMLYGADWNERTTTRFTGWPSASNPYAQPAPFDAPDVEITILHLTPAN